MNSPCFKPRRIEGSDKWQIVWVYPDGEEEVVENGHEYIRQNAYRRAKQLNDENTPAYDINVRIIASRQHCKDLIWGKLKERIDPANVFVLDPLLDEQSDLRYIQFAIKVRWNEQNRDAETLWLISQPPLESEMLHWLESVKAFSSLELKTSYHSFQAI